VQPSLPFDVPGSEVLDDAPVRSLYRDAVVAVTPLRMISAGVDLFMSVLGTALFVTTAKYGGVTLELTKATLPILGAAALFIFFLYRVLFCLADGDTPGVRWTGLTIINFDGNRPTREQRLRRLASSVVSILAAGLGLIWALVDGEKLAWHDHMSQTFATMAVSLDQKS
jgi:uncharacterized RDD family membrane protein YckC